jgi:flavin-dependent dehydrogenase
VGKRSLIIGDAGGFNATISREGIYPAMWSAKIAAEIIAEIKSGEHVQDGLMAFDNGWRWRWPTSCARPTPTCNCCCP